MKSARLIRMWRDGLARQAEARGEKLFMGRPEAWYDDLHWFCGNGHVSTVYLGCEDSDRCLACNEIVFMGPALTEDEFAPILERLDRIKIVLGSSRNDE